MEKIIINVEKSTRMVSLTKTTIGNDLENLQEELVFKFTDSFVNGSARLEYKIGNEKHHIPMTKEGESYTVPIKNVLTKEGKIEMQLVIVEAEQDEEIPVFKSNVFYLYCNKSINAQEEPMDDYEYWLDVIQTKLAEMDEALEEVDNLNIEATRVSDGVEVSITDKEGETTTKKVKDGEKGADGTPGKDALINGKNTLIIGADNHIELKETADGFDIGVDLGEDNTELSDRSIAGGIGSIAGSKAFRVLEIEGTEEQRVIVLDSVTGLSVGDLCSAYVKDTEQAGGKDRTDNFDVFGSIIGINNEDNSIMLDGGFVWDWQFSTTQSYLWVKGKPNVGTIIIGQNAIAFGEDAMAQNEDSIALGRGNNSVGKYAVTTGRDNEANGYCSIANGRNNKANGKYSTATGRYTQALGDYSSTEGQGSNATPLVASGQASHAEGFGTNALGTASHAEGNMTVANGNYSHVEGNRTVANGTHQHVAGKYNVADTTSARITGWGTSSTRKNIEQLTSDGNLKLAGDVYVGCNNDSSGGNKVLTSTDIANKQDKTDTNLETASDTIVGAINEVNSKFASYVQTNDIINDTTHTNTDKPLSANIGKELQDEITNLKAIGRFLSLWNSTTGLPTTNPQTSPYIYKTGDYYIVGTASGSILYKPNGSSYTTGVASTTRETSTVAVGDIYVYDGTNWKLQINTQRTTTFSNIAGQPRDNSNLATELDKYVTKEGGTITGAVTISNQEPTGCKLVFSRANGAYIQNNKNGPINMTLGITTNAASSYRFLSNAFLYGTDNEKDLGASDKRWKDIYVAGNISDGTNNVSVGNIVTKTSYASTNTAGAVKVNGTYGTGVINNGVVCISKASDSNIDSKSSDYKPITPSNLDYAVKKGITTNTNTLSDSEKTSACNWLGVNTAIENNLATKDYVSSNDLYQRVRGENLLNSKSWETGYYQGNGTFVENSDARYNFVELDGAGTYQTFTDGKFFSLAGSMILPLFDKNKTFVKSVTGTTSDITETHYNSCTFTISNQDILDGVKYVAVSRLSYYTERIMVVKSNTTLDHDNFTYLKYCDYKKFTDIPVNNPLAGKLVVFDGDSICEGKGSSKNGYGWGWASRIGIDNKMDWYNFGISGGTITNLNSTGHYISTSIDDIHDKYPTLDYLILEGGTNDADTLGDSRTSQDFGTLDIADFSGNYDNTTYTGALDTLFYKATHYFPKAKIGFIIAHKMGIVNNGYVEEYSNRYRYFVRAMEVCKKWGIPFLNLWDNVPFNPRLSYYWDGTTVTASGAEAKGDAGYMYYDGQHLTWLAYDYLSPIIAEWMKSMYSSGAMDTRMDGLEEAIDDIRGA